MGSMLINKENTVVRLYDDICIEKESCNSARCQFSNIGFGFILNSPDIRSSCYFFDIIGSFILNCLRFPGNIIQFRLKLG